MDFSCKIFYNYKKDLHKCSKEKRDFMKLRNIYIVCRDNYNAIKGLKAQENMIDGRRCIKVSGWNNALNALMNTKNIKSLEKESNDFINAVPEIFRTKDTFNIMNEEWNKIFIAKKELLRTIEDTMDLYEKMDMDTENRIGIDIKLPDSSDFTEFVNHLNDLQFVFTKCPFLQSSDEKFQFENVDVGSTWLTFFVVGGAALTGGSILLNNIAAFIDKCIILRSHYLTVKKQKQDFENEKKSEEEKETVLKYINSLYKKEVDRAIQELEDLTDYKVENRDGDERGRIEQCFDKMRNLFDKGLQIYSTIDASDETKQLFEPLEMKYLEISDKQKLLEKKEEE